MTGKKNKLLKANSKKLTKKEFECLPMAQTQAAEIKKLQLENQKLVKQNQKLHSLQKRIEGAQEEALDAARLKTIFLGKVSHELRTPMNGLLGMIDLALEEGMNDLAREYCSLALKSGYSLLGLLDNLIDITKLETSTLEIEDTAFDLTCFLNDLEKVIRASAFHKDKDLEFVLSKPWNLPTTIVGDSAKLKQVLLNITENGFKYSYDTGAVIMRVELHSLNNNEVILWFGISDCGEGIPAKDLKRVVKPFTQVDESFTRKQKGVGLGLAIVSELVQLLGGELSVESIYGVGTRVEFVVPFKLGVNQKPIDLPTETTNVETILNVLVAEDNTINQRLIQSLLERQGHKVTLARDGEEAHRTSAMEKFDIILMDIQMPIHSGLDVLHMIRSNSENANIKTPIIAVTANAAKGDREKYLEFGMDGYLSKPFRKEELKDLLDKFIKELHSKV